MIKYFKDYIDSINEGLIKTYDGEIVSKNLYNLLIGLNINFSIKFIDNNIKLIFNFFNSIPVSQLDLLFDMINSSIINRGGWFPSQMKITNIHGLELSNKYNLSNLYLNHSQYNIVEIIYESNFGIEVFNIPDKLYHLSITEYKTKILKYGLSPKSNNKLTSHLDRIYLCDSINDCRYLINRMSLYYNEEKLFNIYNKEKKNYVKNTIPIIFEIDNSDKFIKKLYKDPNYINGFYVLDNIPKNKISEII